METSTQSNLNDPFSEEEKAHILRKYNGTISGSGSETVVLAHGYGCDKSMWRFLTPRLSQIYRVVTFDLMGCGSSNLQFYSVERYSNLQAYANDIIELITGSGFGSVHFVGHSVGAIIGMLAAIKRPELFRTLLMVSPSPAYVNRGDYVGGFEQEDIDEMIETLESNYLGWSATITPVITGKENGVVFSDELNRSFCSMRPDIARQFARVTFSSDNRADVPLCGVPTLVLQVTDDVIAPVSVGQWMHKKLPVSELVLLQTVGHCPHMTAPDQTFAEMSRFLSTSGGKKSVL